MHPRNAPALLAACAPPILASYAFYVGSALTADGSVLVGGTGEEVSSHWLQLFPALDHPAGATVLVGAGPEAAFPGELTSIPQARRTHRHLSMEYSGFEGFPAPLTNGGLNEHGVAVRDVWAPNRPELLAMTPNPQRGASYSDLARIVLSRARTAREGAEMIGTLVGDIGEATASPPIPGQASFRPGLLTPQGSQYGGNTHLVADADEGWVVWEMAGGRRLWAAERLGPDDVRVLYPGYIGDFPVDFAGSPDHMASPDIVSFAVEHGWWDPEGGEPFNIFNAYGDRSGGGTARDGGFKSMAQAALEEATLAMAPLTEAKMMERVRDARIADDQAGYGQVVSLRRGVDSDLLRIWIAPTGSVSAPFVPWWLGVTAVPPQFGQHRYLTAGAGHSFLDPDFQLQEATEFAGRLFKRVLYYTCSDPERFLPTVTEILVGFENRSIADAEDWVERGARALIDSGDRDAARQLLTFYSHSRAAAALDLGRTMARALDGYIKLTGRWRNPVSDQINDAGTGNETVNCLVGYNPDLPPDRQPQPPSGGEGAVPQAGDSQKHLT